MHINSILSVVAARLATISRDTPFLDAVRMFAAGSIRMLVVCRDDGSAVGIVTRTDALRHLSDNANPLTALVAELAHTDFISARPPDDLLTTWHMMAGRGLNHVPVVEENGVPIGVLTADDALKALLRSEEYEEQLLVEYVAGIGYR